MIIQNTEGNKKLAQAVASMAIEAMYFNREFVDELVKVANGEKTSEELRQEVLKEYER